MLMETLVGSTETASFLFVPQQKARLTVIATPAFQLLRPPYPPCFPFISFHNKLHSSSLQLPPNSGKIEVLRNKAGNYMYLIFTISTELDKVNSEKLVCMYAEFPAALQMF